MITNNDLEWSTYHLLCDHDNGLEAEPPIAMIEEVFQRRAEEIDDQDVVQPFLAEVVDIGNASCDGRVSQHIVIGVYSG